ncbi:MAG: ATP-binding protein [Elusimicrobia bacterium]|nr:ATP-binding protein [Elusimicrobiota bacterium]
MWIERANKKKDFLQSVKRLKSQVLVVRGARQVGKTSFVLNALKDLASHPQIRINLSLQRRGIIDGVDYFGRDFFGAAEDASQLLRNISLTLGPIERLSAPAIIFIDEADRHPVSLETIQTMAGLSDRLKAVYTGSNLENIAVKNAATGRKRHLDLYPVTFREFLRAYGKQPELAYLDGISLEDRTCSQMRHQELNDLFGLYLRLGGMPRILDAFIDAPGKETLPQLVADLAGSIEENVKSVLGEKTALYEYEDVLRRLALLSMDTLKFSRLQVRHASRGEAKRLVNKTVGARVAHKIRLYESGIDLSKYIIFDAGVLNYLLNGSDILRGRITDAHLAVQYETAVGNEIIATLPTRDDLFYWKSSRGAQVEFILRSPLFAAIDVKSTRGDARSLDSCAVFEREVGCLVKMSKEPPRRDAAHEARIANAGTPRKVPLVTLPHYLSGRLVEMLG